jgi:hypothetical protein
MTARSRGTLELLNLEVEPHHDEEREEHGNGQTFLSELELSVRGDAQGTGLFGQLPCRRTPASWSTGRFGL